MTFPPRREDAYCPACPDPETAFRIEDVGMKFSSEHDASHDGAFRFRLTRPVWEVVMLDHLRMTDDAEHQRVYGLRVAELLAAQMSAQEAARHEVQSAVEWAVRSLSQEVRHD